MIESVHSKWAVILLHSPILLQGISPCPFLSHELSFHMKFHFKSIVQKAKGGGKNLKYLMTWHLSPLHGSCCEAGLSWLCLHTEACRTPIPTTHNLNPSSTPADRLVSPLNRVSKELPKPCWAPHLSLVLFFACLVYTTQFTPCAHWVQLPSCNSFHWLLYNVCTTKCSLETV